MVESSSELSELSDRGFDITVGSLVEIWRQARQKGYPPSKEEVAKALDLIGFRGLFIKPVGKVRLGKAGMSIDLGGIAKDYAVTKAFMVLKKIGYRNLIVNAAGDLRTGGHKSDKPFVYRDKGSVGPGKDYGYFTCDRKGCPKVWKLREVFYARRHEVSPYSQSNPSSIRPRTRKKGYSLCRRTGNVECLIIDKERRTALTPGS